MTNDERALALHYELGGKIEIKSRAELNTREDLSLAYTPGVARPCLEIRDVPERSYELTRRHNLCAVITDGTAVLGLGDIGPLAAMPVMEGKCALMKRFGDVDAFPICVDTKDPDEFVRAVQLISKSFGGINLEDIAAPRCFEIEKRLKACCDIPIFHDDQHGTAIVALAGLKNALKLKDRSPSSVRVVISGAGAAAVAIAKLLCASGFQDITVCDRKGAIYKGRAELSGYKAELAEMTNPSLIRGGLTEALRGADVFIGVSAPGLLTAETVRSMASKPIVFAMANPNPEIDPQEARSAGALVVATGRSDYPNQINNLLAFPGIFRGAFDVRASDINEAMKHAAAEAIAGLVPETALTAENIIPNALDPSVCPAVAAAVAKAAKDSGVARKI